MTDEAGPATIEQRTHLAAGSPAISCDLSAIPADLRDAHFALARSLFADKHAVHEIEDGLVFELSPDRFGDVARFIENERRCCQHLAFAIEVPPHRGSLTLRVMGRGAREELRALLG